MESSALLLNFGLRTPVHTTISNVAVAETIDLSKTAHSAFSLTSSSGNRVDSFSDMVSIVSRMVTITKITHGA